MTARKPSATAAQLREAFVAMMCGRRDCSCSTVRDIDAIIAAVRAEALEEAAKVADRFGVEWRLYGHVTESIAARIRALVHR